MLSQKNSFTFHFHQLAHSLSLYPPFLVSCGIKMTSRTFNRIICRVSREYPKNNEITSKLVHERLLFQLLGQLSIRSFRRTLSRTGTATAALKWQRNPCHFLLPSCCHLFNYDSAQHTVTARKWRR